MKIVITGSLGAVGKPLAIQLINAGHDVTVVSSNLSKAHEIEAIGATPAIGSLLDVAFMKQTFQQADVVHCMIPPAYNDDITIDPMTFYKAIGENYRQAITHAQVKRVTHLSAHGADLDSGTGLILGSYYVEQILNQLANVELTHFRATYFYYNLLGSIASIKATGNIYANYGDTPIPMVDPADVANTIATAMLTSGKDRVRYIASDERTGPEIAHVLGAAIGKPEMKWIMVSDDEMQGILERGGVPVHIAKQLVEIWHSIRVGRLTADYHRNKQPQGHVKLEDYAKAFAKAYHQL